MVSAEVSDDDDDDDEAGEGEDGIVTNQEAQARHLSFPIDLQPDLSAQESSSQCVLANEDSDHGKHEQHGRCRC